MKLKNIAFTLAETLVVMGIIGVIAALTIPNLSQSTGNREKVTKVKKAYATVNEAFERSQAIYGAFDEWFTSDMDVTANATRFAQRMIEFMKISKDCKTGTGCISSDSENDADTTRYKVITADGTSLLFAYLASNYGGFVTSDCDLKGDEQYPFQVLVYLDGVKGKEDLGKNVFVFDFFKNAGTQPRDSSHSLNAVMTNLKTGSKSAAAYWVLRYDNMDYLKTDANWKCPNGKVLNITTNPPITSCN